MTDAEIRAALAEMLDTWGTVYDALLAQGYDRDHAEQMTADALNRSLSIPSR